MAYKIKTAAESEPIGTEEASRHLREVYANLTDDQKTDIDALVTAARQFFEKHTRRQLMPATWYLYLDDFPGDDYNGECSIFLEKSPVTAVSSVKYYDENDELQTLVENTDYFTDLHSEPARIRVDSVPTVYDKPNAVVIEFTAGFTDAASVPEPVKKAMLLMVAHLYENRQEEITGTIVSKLGKGFEYILQHYDCSRP